MKRRHLAIMPVVVALVVLTGCQSAATASSSAATATPAAQVGASFFVGDEMSDSNMLALGTLQLEGTDQAVTREQAAKLLPLWTLIQEGTLQGDAETQAVVKQIRNTMTADQLAAMEAMSLTQEDFQGRFQEQGEGLRRPEGESVRMPAEPGDFGAEDRAALRERFQSMTDEERAAAMAEMGIERPEGGMSGQRPGAIDSMRGGNAMLLPLIELLTTRAAE